MRARLPSVVLAAHVLATQVLAAAQPALAQDEATCAQVSTDASILASADWADVHVDWADGSAVGLGWTFVQYGAEEGADGEWFLWGDLLDARGGLFNEGVYVGAMEWECDVPD